MSTRPDDRRPTSRDVEGALQPHIQVKEKGQRKVEEYPADIERQLKRAAFSEGDAANTYVKHVRPTNDNTTDSKVATVEIRDDELVIDVEDVVGIVNLTPNSMLQIDPKIGWSEILDMFLEVGQQRRSIDYRGIPIRDFLADDIGIEDIFIVVALNYLDSLDDIFRHGFMRSFDREREQGLEGRGRIDIERSQLNFEFPNGVPRHEFVEKTVEYSIPVNDVIYRAGEELERLFHLYAGSNSSKSYTHIFSRIERAVSRLEQRGVTGTSISLRDVSRVNIRDVPRQRRYYTNALEISKTILSSTIGQPLDGGREELLMEYIIGMQSLFEEYVGLALDEEIGTIRDNPMLDGMDEITVAKESHRLFADDSINKSSQPDHVIRDTESPVAVLDSKYYGRNKSPLEGSWSRSRLLSYGFQLQTDCLGMVAPLASPGTYQFNQRPGALHVIAPNEDTFTTEGLRNAIHDFLTENVAQSRETMLDEDLKQRPVSHPEVTASSVEELVDHPQLATKQLPTKSRVILKYIVKGERLSSEVNPRDRRVRHIEPARDVKSYIKEYTDEYDVGVPFFIPSTDADAEKIQNNEDYIEEEPGLEDCSEFIRFHFLKIDEDEGITDVLTPPPFGISW